MNCPINILQITEVNGHRISCVFNNGEYRIIDLQGLLEKWKPGPESLNRELLDAEKVKGVIVDNGTLTWPNITTRMQLLGPEEVDVALDIDPAVLYENSTVDEQRDSAHTLGRQLKQARKAAGLTQAALAKKVGSTRHYISRVEAGKSDIGYKTLRKIAEVGLGKRLEFVDYSGRGTPVVRRGVIRQSSAKLRPSVDRSQEIASRPPSSDRRPTGRSKKVDPH